MTQQEFASQPRIKHNRDLATKYLADNGIFARYPRVSKQAQLVPLDLKALPKYAYNPSIIDHNGMLLMAYRYHQGTLATKLGLAHVNEAGKVLSNRTLPIPGESVEDPRLFKWDGKVCMSWVDSTWPTQPPKSIVRFGVFKDGTLTDFQTPPIKGNDGSTMQKNYVFFEHGGRLYLHHPPAFYRMEADMRWDLMDYSSAPRWVYGDIRGGTCPIPHHGNLLRFFHSSLDNEWGPQPRRYFVGACLMKPDPPFEIVNIGERPVLYGSELDDWPAGDRPGIIQHKINVVFPCGAVKRDGYWLLSVGINDSACGLAKITPEMLHL